MKKFYSIIAPMNVNETEKFSFKRLFLADYGKLVPTDLSVWILLAGSAFALFSIL